MSAADSTRAPVCVCSLCGRDSHRGWREPFTDAVVRCFRETARLPLDRSKVFAAMQLFNGMFAATLAVVLYWPLEVVDRGSFCCGARLIGTAPPRRPIR